MEAFRALNVELIYIYICIHTQGGVGLCKGLQRQSWFGGVQRYSGPYATQVILQTMLVCVCVCTAKLLLQ